MDDIDTVELMDGMSMVVFGDNEVNNTVVAVLRDLFTDLQYVKWMVLLGLIETASIVYPNISSEWVSKK